MYPLLPIELLQTLETEKVLKEDPLSEKKEESKLKPTLIMVDEQPPKVKDIKPVRKSPVIDVFYKEVHFVGKITFLSLTICSHKNKMQIINNFTSIYYVCTVNDVDMPKDKTICFLCQSVLNYVQQEVTDPKVETDIRAAVEKSCLVLPSSFEDQCKQFVDQYGDAFIALIAQEVDPSIVSV